MYDIFSTHFLEEGRQVNEDDEEGGVAVIARTTFDDIEVYRKPFGTRPEAEEYVRNNSDDVMMYDIVGN